MHGFQSQPDSLKVKFGRVTTGKIKQICIKVNDGHESENKGQTKKIMEIMKLLNKYISNYTSSSLSSLYDTRPVRATSRELSALLFNDCTDSKDLILSFTGVFPAFEISPAFPSFTLAFLAWGLIFTIMPNGREAGFFFPTDFCSCKRKQGGEKHKNNNRCNTQDF